MLDNFRDTASTLTNCQLYKRDAPSVAVGANRFEGCTVRLTKTPVTFDGCAFDDYGAMRNAHEYANDHGCACVFAIVADGPDATRIVDVVAAGWHGTYDGEPHGISVTSTTPSAEVLYSASAALDEGNYRVAGSTRAPMRTGAGTTTVHYFVAAPGHAGVADSADVVVDKVPPTLAVSVAGWVAAAVGAAAGGRVEVWLAASDAVDSTDRAAAEGAAAGYGAAASQGGVGGRDAMLGGDNGARAVTGDDAAVRSATGNAAARTAAVPLVPAGDTPTPASPLARTDEPAHAAGTLGAAGLVSLLVTMPCACAWHGADPKARRRGACDRLSDAARRRPVGHVTAAVSSDPKGRTTQGEGGAWVRDAGRGP